MTTTASGTTKRHPQLPKTNKLQISLLAQMQHSTLHQMREIRCNHTNANTNTHNPMHALEMNLYPPPRGGSATR